MVRVRIYSYNQGEGSKNLSEKTGWPRLRHQGSTFRPRRGDVVVNWGSKNTPDFGEATVLNHSEQLVVTDKRVFFGEMPQGIVPDWTTDIIVASGWLTEGHTVVCRKILNGHSGEGIELVSGPVREIQDSLIYELPEAPLYVKYQKKTHEYRVHMIGQKVIDVQQKRRKTDVPDEEVDWKIRNLRGGFIYAREGVTAPEEVLAVASRAHESSGLDFGAYDVIFHEPTRKALVLEVNSAPGLSGTTIDRYAEGLQELISSLEESS